MLVLCATVTRAFVPVGFMPIATHGQTRMMFCPGHMASGDSGSPGPPGDETGARKHPCAYAVSAGGAPLRATPALSAGAFEVPCFAAALAPHWVADAPRRYAAPRGPPRAAWALVVRGWR